MQCRINCCNFQIITKMKNKNETSNQDNNSALHKANVRRSFFQEFNYPLDKVERKWLRRSATILLSPILIIAGALFGAFEMGKYWFNECW